MDELPSAEFKPSKYQLRRLGFGIGHVEHLNHRLTVGSTLIGRLSVRQVAANPNVISLQSLHTSRKHCLIVVKEEGSIFLVDTSSHGTFIGNDKINKTTRELRVGDVLSLGVENDEEQHLHPDYVNLKIELFERSSNIKVEVKQCPNDDDVDDAYDNCEEEDVNLVIDEEPFAAPEVPMVILPEVSAVQEPAPEQFVPMVNIPELVITVVPSPRSVKKEICDMHLSSLDGVRIDIEDVFQGIIKTEPELEGYQNTQQLLEVLDSAPAVDSNVEIIEVIDISDDEEDPLDKQIEDSKLLLNDIATEVNEISLSNHSLEEAQKLYKNMSESDQAEFRKRLEQQNDPSTSKPSAKKKASPKRCSSKSKSNHKGPKSVKRLKKEPISTKNRKQSTSSEDELTKAQNMKLMQPVICLERCSTPSKSKSPSSESEIPSSPASPEPPPREPSPEPAHVLTRPAYNQIPRIKPKLPPIKPKTNQDLFKVLTGKKKLPEDAPKIKHSLPKKIPASRPKDERFPVVPPAYRKPEPSKTTEEPATEEIPEIKAVEPEYKNVIIQKAGPRKRQAHCAPGENKKRAKMIHNLVDIKTPAQLRNVVYRIPKKVVNNRVEKPQPQPPPNQKSFEKNSKPTGSSYTFYGTGCNNNTKPPAIKKPTAQPVRRQISEDRRTPPPPSKIPVMRSRDDLKFLVEKGDEETLNELLNILNQSSTNGTTVNEPLEPMEWTPEPMLPYPAPSTSSDSGLFTRRGDKPGVQVATNNLPVATIKPAVRHPMENLSSFKVPFNVPRPTKQRKQLRKSRISLPRIEYHEIIEHLVNWKTNWMLSCSSESPIHGGRMLEPLKLRYSSFKEYLSLTTDLFELELFEQVKSSYRTALNSGAPHPSYEMYTSSCFIDGNNKTVTLEAFMKGEDYLRLPEDKLPRSGALLLLYFFDEFGEQHQFFGYVETLFDNNFSRKDNRIHDVRVLLHCPNTPLISIAVPNTPIRFTHLTSVYSEIQIYKSIVALEKSPLKEEILDPVKINIMRSYNYGEYVSSDLNMNEKQKQIILEISRTMADEPKNIFLIEGPPGTGKSNLLSNLIFQLQMGSEHAFMQRILVCAPSNAAVDSLVQRLGAQNERLPPAERLDIIRFGKLFRMDVSVRKWSIDEQVDAKIKRDIRVVADQFDPDSNFSRDRANLQERMKELSAKHQNEERLEQKRRIKTDLRKVEDEIFTIETQMYSIAKISGPSTHYLRKKHRTAIMDDCHVVCTTLGSSSLLDNPSNPLNVAFDTLILDEATLATEYQALSPLRYGIKNIILIGDTRQLVALVKSPQARFNGLERSLFQRIEETVNTDQKRIYQLEEQFRMHPDILAYPNRAYYKDRLTTAQSTVLACKNFPIKNYLIFELESEQNMTQSHNVYNTDEVTFVIQLLRTIESSVNTKGLKCAVISPYHRHGNELSKQIAEDPKLKHYEVCTIDSMQGQEKDIVILSCARTEGAGFLALENRLNVALTRAKKCLYICGNFMSLEKSTAWFELLKDARRRDVLVNAAEMSDTALRETIQKHEYNLHY